MTQTLHAVACVWNSLVKARTESLSQRERALRLVQGTTFRFIFRAPVVKPGALAARLERRWSLLPESLPPANTQHAATAGS